MIWLVILLTFRDSRVNDRIYHTLQTAQLASTSACVFKFLFAFDVQSDFVASLLCYRLLPLDDARTYFATVNLRLTMY